MLDNNPPNLLYHYTSQIGLIGMLKSGSMWATSIRYLNDSQEYKYAIDVATKVIHSEKESFRDAQERQLFENLLSEIEFAGSDNDVFVISFSEEGDLLSQWRAYCHPSGGFSIGFDRKKLEGVIEAQHFTFIRCIYDEVKQRDLLRQLIKESLEDFRTDGLSADIKASLVASIFKDELQQIAPAFKHPSFSEEREWRLVCVVDRLPRASCGRASIKGARFIPEVQYRQGLSMIIPYIVFNLCEQVDKILVQRIVVGPTPHSRLSTASVRSMFTELVPWPHSEVEV
jgi:Protein of unknown function (DUF2971)